MRQLSSASRRSVRYDDVMSQNTTQPDDSDVPFDWSLWELDEEEDMGMTPEHVRVSVEVMDALQRHAVERGWTDAFVCMDTFFAWVKSRPNVRVSPDVYLVWGAVQPPPPSWQTWRPGHKPPDFALEVCSADRRKEYDVNPAKYDSLGAGELVIYDPHGLGGRGPLSRYARDSNGEFVAAERDAPVVYSKALDLWLHATTGPDGVALRLCRDPQGESVVLTSHEREIHAIEEAARATERAARATEQAARATKDAEFARQQRAALEAELAALRAQLAGR